MTEEHLTPRQAASLLMAMLQRRGATFALNPDGYFRCDLNGANLSGYEEADDLASIVLVLREEIRQLLREDRTAH